MCESNEEKKKYLNGYRIAKRRVELIQQQIEELRLSKMYPSLNMDGMPHGSGTADLSGYAARVDGLIRKLEAEKLESMTTYTLIHHAINQMEDGAEREVLERRYLLQQKWEVIAVEMHFNYRWVLRIHGRALNHFVVPDER